MNEDIALTQAKNPIALVVLAHGAGANMDSDFMVEMANRLAVAGISVLRFNFPYMIRRRLEKRKFPPDRMNKLTLAYQAILNDLLVKQIEKNDLPIFIGGKSMGSRVAATIVDQTQAKGCICIGFPFHPSKKPETLRLEPLQAATKPVLIVQGERDLLGSKSDVDGYQLPTSCQVVFLPDGDHDLKPRVKSGFKHVDHKLSAVKHIIEFINKCLD